MKNDNQTPRDWLLARHTDATARLNALRGEALQKHSAKATRRAPNPFLIFAALAGIGAAAVLGVVAYKSDPYPKGSQAVAVTLKLRNLVPNATTAASNPADIGAVAGSTQAATPLKERTSSEQIPTSADQGAVKLEPVVTASGAGTPAPPAPHRTPAQIAAAAAQEPGKGPSSSIVRTESLPAAGTPPALASHLTPAQIAANAAQSPGQSVGPRVPAIRKENVTRSDARTATPAAALETWLSANVNKQPKVWLSTVAFSDAAREKITAFYQSLPATERSKYETAEDMYAALAMAMHPLSRADTNLIRQTANGASDVISSVEWRWSNGRGVESIQSFQRYSDGWKMPITAESVDAVLNAFRANTPTSKAGVIPLVSPTPATR